MVAYCPRPGRAGARAAPTAGHWRWHIPALVFRSGASDPHHTRETSEQLADLLPNATRVEPPWPDTEWNERMAQLRQRVLASSSAGRCLPLSSWSGARSGLLERHLLGESTDSSNAPQRKLMTRTLVRGSRRGSHRGDGPSAQTSPSETSRRGSDRGRTERLVPLRWRHDRCATPAGSVERAPPRGCHQRPSHPRSGTERCSSPIRMLRSARSPDGRALGSVPCTPATRARTTCSGSCVPMG